MRFLDSVEVNSSLKVLNKDTDEVESAASQEYVNKQIETLNTSLSAVATKSSNGLMSSSDKTKLDGIAENAEVNVQADFNEINANSDAYIKNKPTTLAGYGITDAVSTSDIGDLAKKNSVSRSDIDSSFESNISSLETNSHTHSNKTILDNITSSNINTWNNVTNKVDKVTGSSLISSTDLAQITTNKNDISTLKGTGDGSIDAMIDDKINTWASQLTDDGTVNTFSEAINWIATHASDYTALLADVANKVDKVSGKGLSTEDFTTVLKNKLDGINVTDTYSSSGTDPVSGKAVAAAIKGLTGDSGTVGSHISDTDNPHSVTASQVGLGNLTNDKQVKGLESGTTSGHVVTWGDDGYTVADSGFTIESSVPSDAKFTDTTYATGTDSKSGLTKLYTSTGSSTDGTMTRDAITTELGKKAKTTDLGTAAFTDTTDYATAAQGSTADTAVQSVKIGTSSTEYKSGTTVTLPAYPTTLPASDVSSWAKASSKPTYTASEVGALADTTTLADLTTDSTHLTVTTAEKTTWNNVTNKVDKVGGSSLISSTDLAQITTNKNDISTLKGSGEGSIDAMIDDKINTWASQLTDDGTVNTYAEAINWIATHASDYTTLLGDVANKVDKVSGKGLSTEDFTTTLKNKLNNLNVTDTYSSTGTDPVSGKAVASAVSGLASSSDLTSHTGSTSNPHKVTASQVGLGNVTNNKQVNGLSSGTTSGHVVTWGSDGYTVADSGYTIATSVPSGAKFTDTTYSAATTSANGLMTTTQVSNLSTAYTHANNKGSAFSSGVYKITTNAYGHVTAATTATAADINVSSTTEALFS
jgi:hypothetical protein